MKKKILIGVFTLLFSSIKFWTIKGELIKTIKAHRSYVSGIVIEKEIMVSSSGADDRTVKVWKLE